VLLRACPALTIRKQEVVELVSYALPFRDKLVTIIDTLRSWGTLRIGITPVHAAKLLVSINYNCLAFLYSQIVGVDEFDVELVETSARAVISVHWYLVQCFLDSVTRR
jgi:hypothetical protein